MELLVFGLIVYVVGRWLVRKAGPMPHLCRGCARIFYGSSCPNCCEHGDDRPGCEECFLDGKRVNVDSIAVTGQYEPPESRWASQYVEPSNENRTGTALGERDASR